MPENVQVPNGQTNETEGQSENQKPPTYDVVINGETKSVSLEDLRNGYMMQSDYTRKTQELSDQRKQLDTLVEQKATELYMKALENQGMTHQQAQQQASTSEGEDAITKLTKEFQEMKGQFSEHRQSLQNKQFDEFFGEARKSLSEKYPSILKERNWKYVLDRFSEEAQDNGNPSQELERIIKTVHDEIAKENQDVIDSFAKSKKTSNSRMGETGASGSAFGNNVKPPTSFGEARERAEARTASMFNE